MTLVRARRSSLSPATSRSRRPVSPRRCGPGPDHGEGSYVGRGLLTDRAALITGGDSDVSRAFWTNVFAMYYLVQAAVPHMLPGTAIVNTISVQAKAGTKSMRGRVSA